MEKSEDYEQLMYSFDVNSSSNLYVHVQLARIYTLQKWNLVFLRMKNSLFYLFLININGNEAKKIVFSHSLSFFLSFSQLTKYINCVFLFLEKLDTCSRSGGVNQKAEQCKTYCDSTVLRL